MARDRVGRMPLWRMAVSSLAGILLALPWLIRVWWYNRSSAKVTIVDPLDQSPAAIKRASDYFNYLSILLGPRHNYLLMGMSAAGLLVALRRPRMRPVVVWSVLLVLLAMPWGLRLGPFRPLDHLLDPDLGIGGESEPADGRPQSAGHPARPGPPRQAPQGRTKR